MRSLANRAACARLCVCVCVVCVCVCGVCVVCVWCVCGVCVCVTVCVCVVCVCVCVCVVCVCVCNLTNRSNTAVKMTGFANVELFCTLKIFNLISGSRVAQSV